MADQMANFSFGLLLVFQVIALVNSAVFNNELTYLTQNGVHCKRCPPGKYLTEDCKEILTLPVCVDCPDHTYINHYNAKRQCFYCKTSCPRKSKIMKNCTRSTNLQCQCHFGYHRYPIDEIDSYYDCKAHTLCSAQEGFGEDYYGNHTHDTKCRKCQEGKEFVDQTDLSHPKCVACSSCSGSYVCIPCNLFNDTVCAENGTEVSTSAPEEESPPASNGQSTGIIIAVVVVVVLVVVVVAGITAICYRKRKQNRRHTTETTELDGRPTLNGDATVVDSLLRTETAEQNQEQSPNFPEWDAAAERKAFLLLSHELGRDWPNFILTLPSWPQDVNVEAIIDYKKEEEHSVPARILGCLHEWKKKCPHAHVATDIIQTLRAIDRLDVIAKLTENGLNDTDERHQTSHNGS